MSQSGDSPQPGLVDAFFSAFGTWPRSSSELLDFEEFQAQCAADWREYRAADSSDYIPAECVAEYVEGAYVDGDYVAGGYIVEECQCWQDSYPEPDSAPASDMTDDVSSATADESTENLDPFQRKLAQFVDRAVYLEKVIGVGSRNGINNTLRVSGSAQGAEFSGFGLAGVVPGVVAGEVDVFPAER